MGIEEIVSGTKTRLGQTSLSDRTLTEYFTAINPQGEPDDAFYETHTRILKSLAGQYNHDIADWQKKYEAEHKPADPDPAPLAQPTNLDPSVQAILDKQNETIEQLSKLVLSQQKSKSEAELRAAAQSYGDSLHCEKPDLWKSAMKFTTISEGMTEAQYNEAVKSTYESLITASGGGNRPYDSAGGDASKDSLKAINAFFARKLGSEPQK